MSILEIIQKQNQELRNATEKLIDFIEKNRIETIVLEGRSARPIADLLRPAWKRLKPEKKTPKIFALGDRVKKYTQLTDKSTRSLLKKPKFDYAGFKKEISKEMPKLMQGKKAKTLVLAEITDSGKSLLQLKWILQRMGFSGITTGAIIGEKNKKIDFIATNSNIHFFYGVRASRYFRKGETIRLERPKKEQREALKIMRKRLRKISI